MPLQVQHLTGGYHLQTVIHDLHLTLYTGEWLSLLGANGSGKSTLLKLMSRLLVPQNGTVYLDGKAIDQQSTQMIAQKLAILPQQQTLPEGLTVRQLVSLGRTPHQPWWQWEMDREDMQQVDWALIQTQMETFCDRPVSELSGGERQRAFLALALAQAPRVLLLDEPTTFLDLHYQLELLELLKRLNQEQNLTIITVLHDINQAIRYSDRLAMLHRGRLGAIGTPAQVVTTANLRQVFGIEATILHTPVGLQICPLAPHQAPADTTVII